MHRPLLRHEHCIVYIYTLSIVFLIQIISEILLKSWKLIISVFLMKGQKL